MTQKLIKTLAPLVLAAAGGSALASGYDAFDLLGPYSGGASQHPGFNNALIQGTVFQSILTTSNVLSGRSQSAGPTRVAAANGLVGSAAGDSGRFNVWGSFANSDQESTKTGALSKLSTDNWVGGIDYQLTPAVTVGFSYSQDNGDGKLGGGAALIDNNGKSYAPYIAWQISPEWSVDATAGWGDGRFNVKGTGNYSDFDRTFYGANLNYTRWMGNWQFSGKASYLSGEEQYKANATTPASFANKLDQVRFNAQAGYWMNGVLPYASLTYASDLSRSPKATGLADDTWLLQVGVNFFNVSNTLYGGVSYQSEIGRSNIRSDVWLANVNLRF